MFWMKKRRQSLVERDLIEQCHQEAESLYRSGTMHCAEAVVEVIRRHFTPETPEALVYAVSGFGGGGGGGNGVWGQCS